MTLPTVIEIPSAVTVKALAGGVRPEAASRASVKLSWQKSLPQSPGATPKTGPVVSGVVVSATFDGLPAPMELIAETR